MPRKGSVPKRDVLPDSKYNSKVVTKLINQVMLDGKKQIAQGIVYGAFDKIKEKLGVDPFEYFMEALENLKPLVETKARMAMHAMYNRSEMQNIVVSQAQANAKFGKNTLLVVVDCHSAKMSLYPDAIEKSQNIAVIDHHRKVEDAIENPIFSFHDSSSSSACELVAELIRYSNLRYPISEKVATLMLSGILLDTNYYRRQTGIRTYESNDW